MSYNFVSLVQLVETLYNIYIYESGSNFEHSTYLLSKCEFLATIITWHKIISPHV
jgi:hypothetical protein